ncbi:MAG: hypothetical protein Kow0029_30510 [Candidatus Rifleibacteriota bacterium]
MRNPKLLIIAVVLIIVALLLNQSSRKSGSNDPLIGKELVSATEIDQIREIAIKTAQGKLLVKHDQKKWRLPDEHGLKADKNRIEELFQRLNNTKIIELVSNNPQRHGDLGVASTASDAPITNPDSTLISLKNAEGKAIKEFYLGKGRQARSVDGTQTYGNDGQYFRYADSDSVYLLASYLWLDKTPANWVSKELVKIAADKIGSISWNYGNGEHDTFSLTRKSASETLSISDLPEKLQTKASAVNSVARAFENLMFDEFIATSSPELYPGMENPNKIEIETLDGFKVKMRISSGPVEIPGKGKMNLLCLSAEYKGTDPDMKAEAEELEQNGKKFVYALREYRISPFMVKFSGLTEPKPEPAPANASGTSEISNPEKVSASHILIAYKGAERSKATRSENEAKKLAEDLLARIKKGEDFGKLAEEYSDCPSGKSAKGSLGEFKHGVMAKEFEKTAFALKAGEISDVIKTPFGYHIIRRDK